MKSTVVIESPYAAIKEKNLTVEDNLKYCKLCVEHSIHNGEAPFAGHLIFPTVLNDDDPVERSIGIACHASYIPQCHVVAFYVDLGISDGMREGLRIAIESYSTVVFRTLHGDIGYCNKLHGDYIALKQAWEGFEDFLECEDASLRKENWDNMIADFGKEK